ncbi:peptidase [Streptomyces sulfonofaciens]|uniref:Neutral metalloproteinase n=1 Tax=Streptomyces sulfonofaciens TaxID=68272 RepID=A0A919GM28_9ACTN|nr:M4 family metallopeptidase [Streptomyces sulfonofaciens]GHH87047.1 peptidase [Streptomyces sulfonofaciens]
MRHIRAPRISAPLTLAGTLAAAVTLLAAALAPTAGADAPPQWSRADAIRHAETAVGDHAADLDLTKAEKSTVRDVVVDPDGSQHVRYDRTYRGLPVLGGDFVVHLAPDGGYRGADRAVSGDVSVPSVTPLLSSQRAAGLGAGALRGAHRGERLSSVVTRPELVVDALHGAPRLAWRTGTAGKDPLGNPVARVVLTDASDGSRIDAWDSLESATGDGKSLYSGTVPLQTTQGGSGYELSDATRGGTYTGDARNKTDLCILTICISRAPADLFTDADNHWGTGSDTDRASAAVDAQYGTDTTFDYYRNVHGRNGIGNDGKGSYNRVHYGNAYNNAFWDDTCFCMTYGDGDGTTFGPLVALDVTGHEMSHGVTAATAGLTYSGESGGLNEATSDIFGTLVEFYAKNASDPGDWLIGEKIVRSGAGTQALRFMDQPSKDGQSADCWSSSVKNLDVHYSSGVANHFAYLLAEGSGPKDIGGVRSDGTTCNGSSLTGIGKDKLGALWYRALTVYMTSSTDYAGARKATLSAASDLYGANSAEHAAVAAAWSAVSVN